MAALISPPMTGSSSICWYALNEPAFCHSHQPSTNQAISTSQWVSGRHPWSRRVELANQKLRGGLRGPARRNVPRCLSKEASDTSEEGGFMFNPPPGTPLVNMGSGSVSPDLNPGSSSGDGKKEEGKGSPLERAVAYKQANQRKASSQPGALSAMERAKAYRARSSAASVQTSGPGTKPLPEALDAPSTLPPVEIVRGKSFVTKSRTPVKEEAAASSSSSEKGTEQALREAMAQSAEEQFAQLDELGSGAASKIAGASTGTGSGGAKASTSSEPVTSPGQEQEQQGASSSSGFSSETISLAALISQNDYEVQQAEMLSALRMGSKSKAESQPGSEIDSASGQSLAEGAVDGQARAPESTPASPTGTTSRPGMEVEIVTRDGIIKRKISKPSEMFATSKEPSLGISSKDFIGLNFGDKKDSRATPAGLVAAMDMPRGALPQVEIITRDATQQAAGGSEESLYKPKVSTWGVFPRPKDISRTYGGGRTIRPGESLETTEEKEAREANTRRLLEEYKRVSGMDLEPQTKAECDAAMNAGSRLLDSGRLTEAMAEFDTVMSKTVFKHMLHGRAMLQKAVCLDSLARSQDARGLYEKLTNHPDGVLRKKARQMLFGFQAAEKLRVEGGYNYDGSLYQRYFDAFADGYNNTYKASEDDGNDKMLQQFLPYSILLFFPVVLVLAAARLKGTI